MPQEQVFGSGGTASARPARAAASGGYVTTAAQAARDAGWRIQPLRHRRWQHRLQLVERAATRPIMCSAAAAAEAAAADIRATRTMPAAKEATTAAAAADQAAATRRHLFRRHRRRRLHPARMAIGDLRRWSKHVYNTWSLAFHHRGAN